jgi:transposase
MGQPFSLDLRERVIAACEAGEYAREDIAAQFRISVSTLYSWLRLYRSTGSVVPAAHGGGSASEADEGVPRCFAEQHNDRTLEEYADLYAQQTGQRFSPSHLSRMFIRHGISRKGRRYAPVSNSRRRSPPSA